MSPSVPCPPSCRPRRRHRLRAALVASTLAAGGAVALAGAQQAAAFTSMAMYSRETVAFATYLFGRTQFCFANHDDFPWQVHLDNQWMSAEWWASVAPHTQACVTRSYAGFPVYVDTYAVSATGPLNSTISVSLPLGPNQ